MFDIDILIDYLTFSITGISLKRIIKLFLLDKFTFVEGNSKLRFYKYTMYALGCLVSYGGYNEREFGSICVSFSGTGCRALESFNTKDDEKFDWYKYLHLLYKHSNRCHVSRLDIACDEKEGILKFPTLVKSSVNHHYVTNFSLPLVSILKEEQIYWGATSSRFRIRIYNKALERHVDGHWMRCELQCRNESCFSFMRAWFECGSLGQAYSGILLNSVRYTTKQNISNNMGRLKTSRWWTKFLETSNRIQMTYPYGLEYNLEKNESYIFGQAGISIALWLNANNGDIEKLAHQISSQAFRYTDSHKSKLDILQKEVEERTKREYDRRNLF